MGNLSDVKEFYVYAWYFKDTNEVFYVGKGKNDRYLNLQKRNKYFLNIVDKYKDNVDVKIIKNNLNEFEAFELEKQLIKEYKEKGECKTNFHVGGLGGYTGNYDSKERNKKLSEYAKKRIGKLNPMFGKTHTKETKEYLRQINLGKKLTEEHKQKLINANIGRKKTQEEIESIKKRMTGKKMSKETYELMMNNLCKYEYKVFNDDILIFSCLGLSKLFSFCKTKLGISRNIVEQIKNRNWTPKFSKHMHLKNIKIEVIDRRVTTKDDECNPVDQNNDTDRSARQL